ncbi:hypothetical protein D6774_02955 [Candidatus Woesearchaeota archaeon]|nr:MAG: hypothetical protein D6774_02955 [Candidatus Woesearchaeota archaeon]
MKDAATTPYYLFVNTQTAPLSISTYAADEVEATDDFLIPRTGPRMTLHFEQPDLALAIAQGLRCIPSCAGIAIESSLRALVDTYQFFIDKLVERHSAIHKKAQSRFRTVRNDFISIQPLSQEYFRIEHFPYHAVLDAFDDRILLDKSKSKRLCETSQVVEGVRRILSREVAPFSFVGSAHGHTRSICQLVQEHNESLHYLRR